MAEVKGQAGRRTSGAGSCDNVEGSGAAVARECTGSPVRLNEGGEPRKAANSSRMRTLFPDPRAGWDSASKSQSGLTSAQPRGGNVLHGPLATGGAYRP